MARPRTVKPRSLRHAALGLAIESVIAENPDLTPGIVADDAGLNEKQLGTLMRGQNDPRYTTLLRLCDGLRVSLAELMLREERLYKEALRASLFWRCCSTDRLVGGEASATMSSRSSERRRHTAHQY